jgi:hypothetical protein
MFLSFNFFSNGAEIEVAGLARPNDFSLFLIFFLSHSMLLLFNTLTGEDYVMKKMEKKCIQSFLEGEGVDSSFFYSDSHLVPYPSPTLKIVRVRVGKRNILTLKKSVR